MTGANVTPPLAEFTRSLATSSPTDTNAGVTEAVPAVAATPTAPANFITGLVSGVLSWLGLNPVATNAPAAPAQTPILWTVLSWVRREINRFVNDQPIADPRQVAETESTGVVLGTFDAVDPTEDPLTYRLAQQAQYGQVEVYPDGTYIYTPNKDLAATVLAAGSQDKFTVRIADQGFTLHNLLSAITGTQPGVLVPVTVDVPARPAPTATETATQSEGVLGFAGLSPITRGFDVINMTSQPIRLESYGDHLQNQVTQSPPVGSVLQPGDVAHFEVVYYFAGNGQVNPTYKAPDGTTWTVSLNVGTFNDPGAKCTSGGGVCTPSARYYVGSQKVALMEKAGGVVRVSPEQAQKQAEWLNRLCTNGSEASCSFVAKSQQLTVSPTVVWQYTTASTSATIKEKIEWESKSSSSVEVSAEAGLKIKKIVSASISAKYSREWTESRKVSREISTPVPPYTTKYLIADNPVVRYTGDFTLKMGNTTWELRNVSFDQPDTSRVVGYREKEEPVKRPVGS